MTLPCQSLGQQATISLAILQGVVKSIATPWTTTEKLSISGSRWSGGRFFRLHLLLQGHHPILQSPHLGTIQLVLQEPPPEHQLYKALKNFILSIIIETKLPCIPGSKVVSNGENFKSFLQTHHCTISSLKQTDILGILLQVPSSTFVEQSASKPQHSSSRYQCCVLELHHAWLHSPQILMDLVPTRLQTPQCWK